MLFYPTATEETSMKWFVLWSCALLVGCTTYYYKEGATPRDFEVDKAACIAQSYQAAPVAMTGVQVGGGYTQPTYTNCYGGYGSVNCTTTGGGYVPPAVIPVDVNNRARNAMFESCLIAKGWSTQKPVATPVVSAPAGTGQSASYLRFSDDRGVCRVALDASGHAWDTRPQYAAAVAEAERRGLNPERCAQTQN